LFEGPFYLTLNNFAHLITLHVLLRLRAFIVSRPGINNWFWTLPQARRTNLHGWRNTARRLNC